MKFPELEWLSKQKIPMWGGHLERGEQITDRQMQEWVDCGIIMAVTKPCLGYVLTDRGRAAIQEKY